MDDEPLTIEDIVQHFAVEISHCSDYGGGLDGARAEVEPMIRRVAEIAWAEGDAARQKLVREFGITGGDSAFMWYANPYSYSTQ